MSRRKTQEGFLAPKSDVAFKELMRIEEVRRCFIGNVLDRDAEEDMKTLKNWYMAVSTVKSMDEFCQFISGVE